ncbi:uncharacterized protein LOC126567151 [Anopheles maculipalpis]|uniref:uncharacterized protein LOC126567151 n=1 Tax=Anopheles maculipalpis TaxID=1496333 RepID=UPI0021596492|nr:uncharacterized protein LOC126567151 [Anopheles maculipalpis]
MFLVLLATFLGIALTWMVVSIIRNRAIVAKLDKQLTNFTVIPSIPVLGSAFHFKDPTPEGIFTTFTGFHRTYGRNLITQSLFNFPSMQICDPKVIEQVMQARTIEKTIIYDFMMPWLGSGLVVSTGAKWAQRRKVITPTFHFKILEDFLVIMNNQTDVLIDKLQKNTNGKDFDLYEHVTYCALDIISESAMGVKLNTQLQPNSEYVKAVKEISDIILKRLFSFLREYKWAFQFTKAHQRQAELLKVVHGFAHQVISERKKQLQDTRERQRAQEKLEEDDIYGKRRMTLLDLLLNVEIDGKPLTDSEIREEVDTFMFAGHDTTTSCISFAAYYLSRDPAIQQRVYDEIQAIVGPDAKSAELTYGTLQELKYLDMVIKETLRINPSVPIIGRRSAGDMVIDGVDIPKGMDFGIIIYALHNDPELYPEPARFDPERFSDEASAKRQPYSYIPFSVGSRNCIGQRYAMLEVKTMLVKLLANYRFLPCEESNRLRIKTDMTLKPVNGTFVKIVPRIATECETMAIGGLLIIALFLLTILYITLKVLRNRRHGAALLKQLPYFRLLPSVPILGSAPLFLDTTPDGVLRTMVDCHRRYGKNFVLQELCNEFKLITSDPRIIEQVMQAKTIIKPNFYRFLRPWVGSSSVLTSGPHWINRRKVINPGFHFKMLQDFLVTMQTQTDILVAKLAPLADGSTDIDVYGPLRFCAMDIICETAMGVRLECQSNPKILFVEATEVTIDLIYKRLFNPVYANDTLYRFTSAGRRAKESLKIIHHFTSSVIRERMKRPTRASRDEENRTCKMTFLDLLLESRLDSDEPLSDDDIRGEVGSFMFAGHETVSSCISFALYYLSRNADVQQRLYDEIMAVCGTNDTTSSTELTFASLQDLIFTEQVIKETLRLNPSVPMIGRMSAGDMVIDGVTIPAGTEVRFNIYVMQNDPDYYPDADQFRPERFAEEPKPFTYLPFSTGIRACIGQRFAMMEMKTLLVKLVSRYRFLPCEQENTLQLKADLTLKPFRGAFIKIEERI